jgi:hypothetical protein
MKPMLSVLCAVFFIFDIYWFHELHRAKELVRIQRVISAANLAVAQSPGLMRQIQALQQVDCSDCPRDFREAWVAYLQEQTDLANQGSESFILDVGAGVAVVSGQQKGAGKTAKIPIAPPENPRPQPAKEHLLRVILKYKSVCPN